MIVDMIARGWENFLARPDGPLNLRFIIQPTIAVVMALRAGIKDAREGRPAYLWAMLINPSDRRNLISNGFKDMRITFSISVIFDVIYQIIVHRWIYPFELLFTSTLLALVPYFLLRGPMSRIAQ